MLRGVTWEGGFVCVDGTWAVPHRGSVWSGEGKLQWTWMIPWSRDGGNFRLGTEA
jgi:hypothetical protein